MEFYVRRIVNRQGFAIEHGEITEDKQLSSYGIIFTSLSSVKVYYQYQIILKILADFPWFNVNEVLAGQSAVVNMQFSEEIFKIMGN